MTTVREEWDKEVKAMAYRAARALAIRSSPEERKTWAPESYLAFEEALGGPEEVARLDRLLYPETSKS